MKVVINKCFGGFGLSVEAYKFLNIPWDGCGHYFIDDRSNPALVKCVEALGDKAGGEFESRLKVVEIPDDVEWEIDEYGGVEWVIEKHRTWE